jgi:hypothetical protein
MKTTKSKKIVDDNYLVKQIKLKSCNDSLIELISRHSGICFSIGKKILNASTAQFNELSDNKDWIIYSSALSFKPDMGSKFSTWLANNVKYFCLNLKNKISKYVNSEEDLIEFLLNKNNCETRDSNKVEAINTIIDLLDKIEDKNIKDAIYYRYLSNKNKILNYAEVAKILNVTPQTALNWHNKFIDLAKKKLTS